MDMRRDYKAILSNIGRASSALYALDVAMLLDVKKALPNLIPQCLRCNTMLSPQGDIVRLNRNETEEHMRAVISNLIDAKQLHQRENHRLELLVIAKGAKEHGSKGEANSKRKQEEKEESDEASSHEENGEG